jgi:glycine dehydrogenase subunit 1
MRYLPHTAEDRTDMLAAIGVASIDDLFADIPEDKRLKDPVGLPKHKSELEVNRTLRAISRKNHAAADGPFFVGAGAYRHHVPAMVDHIIQRSEFLTSYTPYQPEISQGTLQYLFEFQTQVANLTAMEVANASMYDGSTGTAEAVLMAHRLTKRRNSRRSTRRRHASSCRHLPSTASSSTSSGSPRRRMPRARCLLRSSPRSFRSGSSSRRALRVPISWSARASRSATH